MWIKCLLLLLLSAAMAAAQQPAPEDARGWMNRGVSLFREGKYPEAVEALERATRLEPENATAHLYLGSALMSQTMPGSDSPEQTTLSRRAEEALMQAQRLKPADKMPMQMLASLMFQRSQGNKPHDEKIRQLDESAVWHRRVLEVDEGDKTAHYSLGVIGWSKMYPDMMQARRQSGMRPEDPGPISVPVARQDLRLKHERTLDEAIRHFERALAIDPTYDDAMAYLNLVLRIRADMQETPEAYRQDIAAADGWVQKALETKKAKGGAGASSAFVPAPPPPSPGGAGSRSGVPPQIRIGGAVQANKLVYKPEPVYPPLASQARIQGVVRFTAVVGRDGTVEHLTLVSGHPLLVPAATETVRQYRYQPTLLNGAPVEVVTQVDVNFVLQ
jgi:TonB family protein